MHSIPKAPSPCKNQFWSKLQKITCANRFLNSFTTYEIVLGTDCMENNFILVQLVSLPISLRCPKRKRNNPKVDYTKISICYIQRFAFLLQHIIVFQVKYMQWGSSVRTHIHIQIICILHR